MEKKWNLQDIKPAGTRKRRVSSESTRSPREIKPVTMTAPEEVASTPTRRVPTKSKTSKTKHSGLLISGIIFFVVIGGGFLFSFAFGGAEVTVYPRHREPTVNSIFTANTEAQAGELAYEVMTLEAEGERQVTATGQEQITKQATGEITIYKTTSGSERLIKNTRFESSNGLIFRATESVVVPGATTDSSGQTVPGKIKAQVFADEAGDKYNLSSNTKFTVPGFKEGGYTDLYQSIYGTNEADITGGYDGLQYTVDNNELSSAKESLEAELRDSLKARVSTEKPSGFIVFDSAIGFVYETLPTTKSDNNKATIKEKAILQIPIFKDTDFASFIAKSTVPGYEGEAVRLDKVEALNFSYTSASSTETDLSKISSISFKLTGQPQLVWTFDEAKLKNDLLGASKTALTTILGAYPAIERAEAVIRPVWKRSFPEETTKITIKESLTSKTGE